MNRKFFATSIGALLLGVCGGAQADAVTFSGASGSHSASASFDIVNGNLQVVLTNTSMTDALVPTDILTALFFNITGDPLLARTSVVSNGPTFFNSVQISPTGAVVGGEYAYLNGLSQYGANSGISNSGLGLFGPADLFPGANLEGPDSPDGIQYGLTSAGDNLATGNSPLFQNALTKNSVTITLGALPTGFSLSNLSNVTFQYGTALSEGHFGGTPNIIVRVVPEPATLGLLGVGLVLAGLGRRRRHR